MFITTDILKIERKLQNKQVFALEDVDAEEYFVDRPTSSWPYS